MTKTIALKYTKSGASTATSLFSTSFDEGSTYSGTTTFPTGADTSFFSVLRWFAERPITAVLGDSDLTGTMSSLTNTFTSSGALGQITTAFNSNGLFDKLTDGFSANGFFDQLETYFASDGAFTNFKDILAGNFGSNLTASGNPFEWLIEQFTTSASTLTQSSATILDRVTGFFEADKIADFLADMGGSFSIEVS